MNRTWKTVLVRTMALGLMAGLLGNAAAALAQMQQERALRPLRTAQSAPAWTAPQPVPAPRTARTYRPWVDPAKRAQMQRDSHPHQIVSSAEVIGPGHVEQGAVPMDGGHSGPIVQQGEAPVVDGFHSGSEMIDPGCGCTNSGDCGCGDCGGCGCGDCGCEGGCGFDGGCCNDGCDSCGPHNRKICVCVDLCWFKDLEIGGGVHAFQSPGFPPNPVGFGNGNFGFQESINLGAPFPCLGHRLGLGMQVGWQGVQSNFMGRNAFGGGVPDFLKQSFFTAGLFHRALCGIQGGVVWDHMRNEYLRTQSFEYHQVRGEISFVGPRQNEIGFLCNIGTSGTVAAQNPGNGVFPSYVSNFYGGFVRHRTCSGGDFRVYVGATETGVRTPFLRGGNDDANRLAFGADLHVPLGKCLALNSGFTYLLPLTDNPAAEGWNIGINLVWYPFKSRCCPNDPCWGEQSQFRPLFNMADNGNMFIRR